MKEPQKTGNFGIRLLIIAFAEGATVMACELLGAKMTAPFFGTSLYSWASVLAVTLSGLAAGYYIGGLLTTRFSSLRMLFYILLASGLFLFMMPWLATLTMSALAGMSLSAGLLLSMLIFLLPPILLFGMVSPVIIHLLVHDLSDTGKTAGRVYGISTVGGVINTLLMGFWIIPEFGLKGPAMIYGTVMAILPFILLPLPKKGIAGIAAVLILLIGFSLQKGKDSNETRQLFTIRYSSEGLLGQVKVVDYANRMDEFGVLPLRGLLVNNTWQTVIHRQDGTGMLDYTYFLDPLLSKYGKDDKALLIGLGGGTVPSMIRKYGPELTVVELDERLPKLAKRFFGMAQDTKVIVDDGRHFLRQDEASYDLIIFDAFLGENPPWHLLTLETFEQVRGKLNPGGAFLIEFYGFLEGEDGQAARSVFYTLQAAGFVPEAIMTGEEPGLNSNFIFIATESGFDFDDLDYSQKKYTDKSITDLRLQLMDPEKFYDSEPVILADNLPALDHMLMRPARTWRESMNEHFRDLLMQDGKPVFY